MKIITVKTTVSDDEANTLLKASKEKRVEANFYVAEKEGGSRKVIFNVCELSEGDDDLISGWESIAAFIGKNIRTIERWKTLGYDIPIFSPVGEGTPYASKKALKEWLLKDRKLK